VDAEITRIFENTIGDRGGSAKCPCLRCVCVTYRLWSKVQIPLLSRGFVENFIREGEG
jgi:hypothetical protein